MRLIKQNIIEKDGSGTATLLPEEPEDMVSQSVQASAMSETEADYFPVALLQFDPRERPPTSLRLAQSHHRIGGWKHHDPARTDRTHHPSDQAGLRLLRFTIARVRKGSRREQACQAGQLPHTRLGTAA
jgi:hypothetical protein